jgi:hypothetical protein
MSRLASGCALCLLSVAAACGNRGAVTFDITAPTNNLYNPVAPPATVSEYDIRTASGTVIGIASAVQSSGNSSQGRLPLGALMPSAAPVDVYVTALSGGSLIGEARIRDVTIKSGRTVAYEADLRKPLIFVGAALPAETTSGNSVKAVQILDPNASTDLSAGGHTIAAMTAGAVSWDGRFLFLANGGQLGAFDTGSGTGVAGMLTLPFSPTRLAVAPRDQALVALDPGNGRDGSLALVSDLAGLAANPAQATVRSVTLTGQVARAVAFAPDGSKMYVLTGGTTVDPCSPGVTAPNNAIVVVDIDGTIGGTFTLPGFISDVTVDPATGTLVLADATSGQISTLDLSGATPGAVGPAKLTGGLQCPSAVRVVDGVAFVVTSTRDTTQANAFMLQRVPLASGISTALSFIGPTYLVPFVSTPSANGNIQAVNMSVRPTSIEAYELAITPDGNRAEFATRAHYVEKGTDFTLSDQACTANFDIVEYGLYAVDVRTGNASYTMRSQIVVAGANDCIDCGTGLNAVQVLCDSIAGDRPAGLAAAFGP